MDREYKINENMNKIYGLIFGECTKSLQLVFKGDPDYEKKSKDWGYLWLIEELKKTTTVVDVK